MARPSNRRRGRKSASPFLEKGLTVTVLGLGMWTLSAVLAGHPMLGAAATALRTPAWWAIGIGALLMCVHALLSRRKRARDAAPPNPSNPSNPPNPPNPPNPSNPPVPTAVRPQKTPRANPPEPAAAPAGGDVHEPRDAATAWSPAVFAAIEWRRFEAVCEALFAQAGFETRSQSHGADGGVDIWLHSKNATGPVAVVQCKHWQGQPVGVKELREFFGVMASHGLQRGTYATTSTYTADARAFAKANGISALDGAGLLGLIAQRTPEQQQALLAVAHEGEYWRPTCASCGVKMKARQSIGGGSPFWGCASFPRCRRTLPMTKAAAALMPGTAA